MDRKQLSGLIRNANFWNTAGKQGGNGGWPKPNDPGALRRAGGFPALRKLPEEEVEEAERLRLNGPKPEPPSKIPRPMNDRRAIVVGSLMDKHEAASLIEGFVPDTFDINRVWLNPDNANEIQPDKFCVFFGKRRTGKSFALRWLLSQGHFLFNNGLVLTNTDFNHFWQKHFPKQYVEPFDPIILRIFLEVQGKEVERWIEAGKPRHHNPYKIIILDDVVGQSFRYVDEIQTFATRGRHYCTSIMMTTQYPKLISSSTRTNTDFAFIFFQQNINEKLAIAEEYFNTIPLDNALDMIEQYTDIPAGEMQRSVLVLDQITNSRDVTRKIFTCEPVDPGEFVVGSPEFWRDDPRYLRLERKGAFRAWEDYSLYLKGGSEARVDPIQVG
jgi:hypothetical protein